MEAAVDVAMVVSKRGKINAATFSNPDLHGELNAVLVGKRLVDTVTDDSLQKAEELLHVANGQGPGPVVRDLVHRLPDGSQLPVRYGAVPVFGDGRVALLGRDQRAVAALQQQVLDAQMALEQDYWRLRHVEARYRLLFQMAGEPLLIVDELSRRVLEANPLADKLLAPGGKSIVGKALSTGLDKAGSAALLEMLQEASALGRGSVAGLRAATGSQTFGASATLLRQGDEARFLVRLSLADQPAAAPGDDAAACIDGVMRHAPDAVVLTDTDGHIRAVNQTFLEIAQLASEEQVIGRSIDRWLGRSGVDLSVLLNNLRQHESVRLFATKLRSEFGMTTDVEISVGSYADGDRAGFAFFIRDVGRRLAGDAAGAPPLPRSVEQITQQVGRVPLKDLVRQSTDLVEKLCIETALELTGDNRASAAELLGVSRQGLYAKLNRYNLADKSSED
ncbi:MAG: transcriptional regulator PpsR [Gammaproteobacteria bacterium]|nr:transcriptional regulator PpsR [Gammaproteobacteria bacterium]